LIVRPDGARALLSEVVACKQSNTRGAHHVQVPLSEMFGYSSALRSQTAGKGEYSMEFERHAAVTADKQAELTGHYKR
jgi:elongation factor G